MILAEARPYLTTLATLAPQLNEATDRYMDELREIEETLATMNLGIEVELDQLFFISRERTYRDPHDEEHGVKDYFYLGYGCCNVDDRHILVHRYEHESWPNSEFKRIESKPLLECSRHIRLEAAAAIPSLLEKLASKAERKIESVQKVSARWRCQLKPN